MKHSSKRSLVAFAIVAALAAPSAYATDGYFSHGYSMKEQGMGGAGVAYPQDSLAAATNPAGMVLIGNRVDVGLTWFRPNRSATITGNQLPPGYPNANGTYDGNGKSNFFIPEFGYNHMLNPNMSLGVSVYGNGGMDTHYTQPIPLLGTTDPGVDLSQLIVAPTFAMKVNPKNAIGISLNLAYQRFAATGLQNFTCTSGPGCPSGPPSSSPSNVTNNGYDSSTGWGVRIGWVGQITPIVSLGATYQTKTYMGKFNKYKGLFAGQGSFDIPANYALGVAVKATPKTVLALDVERILYGGVPAIANSGANQAQLGSNNGPGFGWRNVTVVKVGIAQKVTPNLTLRAGYNHSDNPIPATQTFFNILAPGVVKDHMTLGATWKTAPNQELTFAYMHAFSNTVNGSNSIPPTAGGGNANISLSENSFGVAYGWKF